MQTLYVQLHLFDLGFQFYISYFYTLGFTSDKTGGFTGLSLNVIPLYIQVGDLGYAHELGNYAEYSGAPNEEETLQYARALIDVSLSSAERSLCSSGAP
jgi:hypothetical protein